MNTKKEYYQIIVGVGIYGATSAYKTKLEGKHSLVIDIRSHIGGNMYCESVESFNVHKYGISLFHTNNKKVWVVANSIIESNRYTNSPIGNYKGRQYNLNYNMNTFYQIWGILTPKKAHQKAVISRDYSAEENLGIELFDTINDERNNNYYRKDKELVDYKQNVTIGGRLVDCKHYDIAPIIEKVLEFRL